MKIRASCWLLKPSQQLENASHWLPKLSRWLEISQPMASKSQPQAHKNQPMAEKIQPRLLSNMLFEDISELWLPELSCCREEKQAIIPVTSLRVVEL